MINKKEFFKRPSVGEIRRKNLVLLDENQSLNKKDLVKRILDSDAQTDSLELSKELIPENMKRGLFADYKNPRNITRALSNELLPYQLREVAIEDLAKRKENNTIGFFFYPATSGDNRARVFTIDDCFEGAKLFAYSTQIEDNEGRKGIVIQDKYLGGEHNSKKGAIIGFKVPSTTTKSPRYEFTMLPIPIINNDYKNVLIWSLEHKAGSSGRAVSPREHFSGYTYLFVDGRNTTNQIIFDKHKVAAYIALARREAYLNNKTVMDANPFVWPSELGARIHKFAKQNIVVNDNGRRRHLRLEEVSNILMVSATMYGANAVFYNDKKRDPMIQELW